MNYQNCDSIHNDTIVKIYDESDNLIEVTKNVTALPGRISTFEKTFLPRTDARFVPEHHITLREIIELQNGTENAVGRIERQNQGVSTVTDTGVPDTPTSDPKIFQDYFDREVSWFCVGNWGIFTTPPIQTAKPKNHETRLYNMIPFLCIPVSQSQVPDWDASYRDRYAMRRRERINGVEYYTYYLKRITVAGGASSQKSIMVTRSDGTPYSLGSPNNRLPWPWHNSDQPWGCTQGNDNGHPLTDALYVFTEYELKIEPEDFKDFFKATGNGSLDMSHYITEAGLVMGNQVNVDANNNVVASGGRKEVRNAELYSKIVHSPIYMDSEFKAARLQYTIFVN